MRQLRDSSWGFGAGGPDAHLEKLSTSPRSVTPPLRSQTLEPLFAPLILRFNEISQTFSGRLLYARHCSGRFALQVSETAQVSAFTGGIHTWLMSLRVQSHVCGVCVSDGSKYHSEE